MRQTGEPNSQLTVVVVAVFAFALVACVFLLQAYFYHSEDRETALKVVAVAPEELAQTRAQQQEQLNSYRWIDQKAQVAGIPIDHAMDFVVREGVAAWPTPAATPRAKAAGK